MIHYITSFEFTSLLALFVYWIPLSICAAVYFFRGIDSYRRDIHACTDKHYRPTLTIGVIIWHALLSITPCINLFALVFDCASSVFQWLARALDVPLVRRKAGPSES